MSLDPGAAMVLDAVGGVYRLRLDSGGEVDAYLRGRLKRAVRTGDRVVAGDRVRAARLPDEPQLTIEEVLDRRNELVRAGPGGRKPKVVAANLDRCLVVLSAREPLFQREIADRFLVLAESCGIPPVLVLNKSDLPDAPEAIEETISLYRGIGTPVLVSSARSGQGLDDLRGILARGVSAMVGPSGVGKSSLLNALDPDLELRTAPVSRRGGRGRHTTVGSRLIPLGPEGWVADTPGFSDCALWGVDPRDLPHSFPEFAEPSLTCRFRGCAHLHEPGCGVKAAVEVGAIPASRYQTYAVLHEESRPGPR